MHDTLKIVVTEGSEICEGLCNFIFYHYRLRGRSGYKCSYNVTVRILDESFQVGGKKHSSHHM